MFNYNKNSFRNFVIIKHPVDNNKSIFYYSTGKSNKGKNFPNCWFPAYMIEPYGKKYSKNFKKSDFSSNNYFGWIHKKSGLFLKLKTISRDKKEKKIIKKIFNIDDIDFFLNNARNLEKTKYKKVLDIDNYILLYNFLNKFKSWEELQISAFLSFTDKENWWQNNKYFKQILNNILKYTLKNFNFSLQNLNVKDKIDLENVIVRKFSNLKDKNNLCKGNFSKIINNEDKYPYPKRFLIFNNWLLKNNIDETKKYFKDATKHDLENEVLEILKDKEFNKILKIYKENKDEYYKDLEKKRKEKEKILEINMNEPVYKISDDFKINFPVTDLKKASNALKKIIEQNENDINSGKIKEQDRIKIFSFPLSTIKKKLVQNKFKILNDYILKNYEKVN